MKKFAVLFLFLLLSVDVLACKEDYNSSWHDTEMSALDSAKWVSLVEVQRIEYSTQKRTYFYKVIRNLKGKGPQSSEMKIGPYFYDDKVKKSAALTWKNKACEQFVHLQKGKQYIVLSNLNNPNSIQENSPGNEFRIAKILK